MAAIRGGTNKTFQFAGVVSHGSFTITVVPYVDPLILTKGNQHLYLTLRPMLDQAQKVAS